MKYKAIVLDHDDTVVNSTESVNYVSFTNVLKQIRPQINMSLEDFIKYNFEPGFNSLCYDILQFSQEDMDFQVKSWQDFISKHSPEVYDGLAEILWAYHDMGGKIFVVSHSMARDISRHYKEHKLPHPEKIYGWEYDQALRKPSTWPIEDIVKNYNYDKNDLVMIDDLKPGKIMADNAGIDFIWAGWGHNIKDISDYMIRESKYSCLHVDELKKIIL